MEWLSPSTEFAMKKFADRGIKHIVLIPIAFVNEHIETLHELDIEYADELGKEVSLDYPFKRKPSYKLRLDFLKNVIVMK